MATLQTHINRMPAVFSKKYASARWIEWANEILEKLSGDGMMPLLKFNRGVVTENDYWITKPHNFRQLIDCYAPENIQMHYPVREDEGKLRLTDHYLEPESSPDTPTSFTSWATDSFEIDLTGKDEDEYENYLFVVSGGTYAGRTYVIGSNDATDGATTKLYFLHEMSTALDGTKVTGGYLTDPDYYLMLRYWGSYEEISSTSDEIPVDDDYERRLMKTGLRWKAEEHASATSKEAALWERHFMQVIRELKGERRMPRQGGYTARGRRLVGYESFDYADKDHPDYSEFLE